MGLKSFFQKVKDGVKRGATKVFEFGKNVVEKSGHIIRPIVKVAETVSGIMRHLPGKAGKAADAFSKGLGYVKGLVNYLPNSETKTKMQEGIDRFDRRGRQMFDEGGRRIDRFNQKVLPWVNGGIEIVKKIDNDAQRFIK